MRFHEFIRFLNVVYDTKKKKKKIKNQSLIGENICKEYTLIRVSYTLEFFIEFFEIQQQKGK